MLRYDKRVCIFGCVHRSWPDSVVKREYMMCTLLLLDAEGPKELWVE